MPMIKDPKTGEEKHVRIPHYFKDGSSCMTERFRKDLGEAVNFIKMCRITDYLGGLEDLYERLLKELVLMKMKAGVFEYTELFTDQIATEQNFDAFIEAHVVPDKNTGATR